MCKLLISPTTYGRSAPEAEKLLEKHFEIIKNPYGRQLTAAEFSDIARGCAAVIAGSEKITGQALKELPELRVISRHGAGLDNVDLETAERLGIKVYNTPEAPARAVAELAVCLMLNAARHVPQMHAEMKNGVWRKRTGFLLQGKNVGIVGFGRIGQKVAELLRPFEVHIRYYDVERKNGEYEYEPSMEELLDWAHIVTLHCPASEDGRPVIGRDELTRLRNEAVLVNTARGSLIDESALYEKLLKDPDMTAALDVYAQEPYSGAMQKLPNVILTPHIASAARETRRQMDMEAAVNCLKGLGIAAE